MLKDIQNILDKLEDRRQALTQIFRSISPDQLEYKTEPDKWSLLQELQHIVRTERAIRLSEEALRDNPVRAKLKPGKMVDVVKKVLKNDVPVDVPDPSFEPDGKATLSQLLALWDEERQLLRVLFDTVNKANVDTVMFSYPATGPLTPMQTLELALIHLDNHHRRINDHLQGKR